MIFSYAGGLKITQSVHLLNNDLPTRYWKPLFWLEAGKQASNMRWAEGERSVWWPHGETERWQWTISSAPGPVNTFLTFYICYRNLYYQFANSDLGDSSHFYLIHFVNSHWDICKNINQLVVCTLSAQWCQTNWIPSNYSMFFQSLEKRVLFCKNFNDLGVTTIGMQNGFLLGHIFFSSFYAFRKPFWSYCELV